MPLNIELLEQVKEQILSHPEKFSMERQGDCGCIADFVVAGKPARYPWYWEQVMASAEWELFAQDDNPQGIGEDVRKLFYPEEWDSDLYRERFLFQLYLGLPEEFQKFESQLAVQMIDRLIAKYPER